MTPIQNVLSREELIGVVAVARSGGSQIVLANGFSTSYTSDI